MWPGDVTVRCAKCGHRKPYPDTDVLTAWIHAKDGGDYIDPRRLEWDEPAPSDLLDRM